MRPGAVLAQWIPLDQQSDALDRSMLAAMRAEFSEVWVYLPSRVEGVVLASASALTPDLAQWTRAAGATRVRENLMNVGFSSASSLLSTLVLDTRGTDAYIAHAPPMTDDLPRVEYYRSFGGGGFDLASMLSHAIDPTTLGASSAETAAERLQMRAHMRSVGGDARGASELAAQAQALRGETSYTRYLTSLEFDCLNLDAP
jgi:spermidine synthase